MRTVTLKNSVQFKRMFLALVVGILLVSGRPASAIDPASLGPGMKVVEAGGVPVAYSDQGQGETIMVLASYPFGTGLWSDFAKRMSSSYRVVVVEAPGIRAPETMKGDFSAIHLLVIYRDVLIGLGIPQAHIVGVGEGGAMAMAFGHHWPNKVASVVSINGFESSNWSDGMQATWNFFKDPGDGARQMLVTTAALRYQKQPPSPQEFAALFAPLQNEDHRQAHSSRWKAFQEDIQTSIIMMMLPNLNRPTLVVRSKNDQLFADENIERTKKLAKQARIQYEIIENAGHLAFLDQPDKVAALVKDFLGKNSIGGAPKTQ